MSSRRTPEGYPVTQFHDEVFDPDGRVRPAYAELLDRLAGEDLAVLAKRTQSLIDERGVAFGGEQGHPFAVDPVPRILTGDEWEQVSTGVAQRVRALDAFLDDAYGDRNVVRDAVVPEAVVIGSDYYENDLTGVQPRGGARITLAGLDLVRDGDGRFRVLEDNVRTPSGIGYAMAAADAVAEVLGTPSGSGRMATELRRALRGALEAAAPDVAGELVLLTEGPDNSAYYEHAALAEVAGLELCTPAEVRRDGDRLVLADGRRVRSLYHRTGEDVVRDDSGALCPMAELLLEPVVAGELGMANWFGNGVADDKEVYAYVDDLVRYYLDEEPAVPSVRTYDLADRAALEEVLDRLPALVVKPRSGQGGEGVVVGPTATAEEIDRARDAVRKAPEDWIAQDVVRLSTHPTVVDGRMEPRHVDLRPFALYDGQDVTVLPGGLTRVALQVGSMVVNSSQDGGGKATWVR
jgi:uncharacterized circularly permuted ATP-grasp superfamily protein